MREIRCLWERSSVVPSAVTAFAVARGPAPQDSPSSRDDCSGVGEVEQATIARIRAETRSGRSVHDVNIWALRSRMPIWSRPATCYEDIEIPCHVRVVHTCFCIVPNRCNASSKGRERLPTLRLTFYLSVRRNGWATSQLGLQSVLLT